MSIKVGINGFGRIGRLVFRAGISRSDIEFVGINDPFMTPDYMAYMLRYDTMHGQFDGTIEYTDDAIIVNGKTVKFFACMDPKDIPWGKVGAEYVVESTGMFLTKEKAQAHIDAGAKKVVMSAPSKDDTPMFVMGVNHETYDSSMNFVSNASSVGRTKTRAEAGWPPLSFTLSKKPRRVRTRRREANKSRFLQRHVRRRKHFSARARWAASGSKKRRNRFFDGQRKRKPSGFRSLWLDSLTCGPQNTYG